MSQLSRWSGISFLAIAVPVFALSCGDTDANPEPGGGAGQASGGEESSAGADGDAGSGTPAGEQGGAGGAAPTPVSICGLQTAVSECDPITGAGCDVANGATCDHYEMLGGFKCFADSPAKAGEFCDNATVFCGVGTFCNPDLGACQHYCCVDQDCGEGVCFRGYFADGEADIGLCSYEFGGGCFYELDGAVDCGVGGAGGAAGSGGAGQ
jgi:hypothetical protein